MRVQRWLLGVVASVCAVALGAGPAPASTSDPPALELHTAFVPPGFGANGDLVTFESTVTNVGPSVLTGLEITGSLAGGTTCPTSSLDPGQSTVCRLIYAATQSDVDAGLVTETATATALDPVGAVVTSPDSSDAAPGAGISALTLRVAIAPGRFNSQGDTVALAYTVANAGSTTLHNLELLDDRLAAALISCPATTLAPAAEMTCTATYAITAVDVRAAWITDTATAGALDPHDLPVASPAATVTIAGPPRPSLELTVSTDAAHVHAAGDAVRARFVVTNAGPAPVGMIGLSDARIPPKHLACPASTLAPGRSMTCAGTIVPTTGDIARGQIRDNVAAWGTEPLRGLVVTAPAVTFVVTWPHPAATTATVDSPPRTVAGEHPAAGAATTPARGGDGRRRRRASRCPTGGRAPAAGRHDAPARAGPRPRPGIPSCPDSGLGWGYGRREGSSRDRPVAWRPFGQPATPPSGSWRVGADRAETERRGRAMAPFEHPRHKRPASARGPPEPAWRLQAGRSAPARALEFLRQPSITWACVLGESQVRRLQPWRLSRQAVVDTRTAPRSAAPCA